MILAIDLFRDNILPKPQIFTLKNTNGDTLYCRLFLPLDFDSTKDTL